MSSNSTPGPTTRIIFLDFLRATAALLVVWDHLVAGYNDQHRTTWAILTFVREQVNIPLGIIQDFGFLGVAVFFLVSGFVITHVAQRETIGAFVLRRLFRIYPPLIFSLLVIEAFTIFQAEHSQFSFTDFLWASTLANYVRVPQIVINGVGWTLVVELLFYACIAATHSLIKNSPGFAVLIISLAVALVIAISRACGDSFFLFAASFTYIPFLCIGQIVYFSFWQKSLRFEWFAALFLVQYALLVWALRTIHTQFLPLSNSYFVSFAIALLIFLICLGLNEHLRLPRPLKQIADSSYSIYLLHGTIGVALLDLFTPIFGYTLALGITLAGVFAVCFASFKFIETPTHKFGAFLSRLLPGNRTP